MALVEQAKRGGRYTRKEQEERKLLVYQLHIVERKSAVQIADLLNVNRNTINQDIKSIYKQFGSRSNSFDLSSKMNTLIQRIKIQNPYIRIVGVQNGFDFDNVDLIQKMNIYTNIEI